jgi:hypothetical protein
LLTHKQKTQPDNEAWAIAVDSERCLKQTARIDLEKAVGMFCEEGEHTQKATLKSELQSPSRVKKKPSAPGVSTARGHAHQCACSSSGNSQQGARQRTKKRSEKRKIKPK